MRKRLKEEMLSTRRAMAAAVAFILIGGVFIGLLLAVTPGLLSYFGIERGGLLSDVVLTSELVLFAVLILGVTSLVYIFMACRHYKSFCASDGGGASNSGAFACEFIVSYFWALLIYIAVAVSAVVMMLIAFGFSSLLIVAASVHDVIFPFFDVYQSVNYVFAVCAAGVVAPALSVLTAYAFVAVGCRLSAKHRVLSSAGACVVLNLCISQVYFAVSLLTGFFVSVNDTVMHTMVSLGINVALTVVMCFALWFVVRRLAGRRNNFA